MNPQTGLSEDYVNRYRRQFGAGADPYQVVNTLDGVNYNRGGDVVPAQQPQQPSQYELLQRQLAKLQQQQQQVYAPTLNYAQINAQARKQAQAAVNPRYVKELQLFQQQQQLKRQQQQQQYQTNVADIERQLQQGLESSGIQRERTAEDTAQNLSEISNQADIFQTDSSQQFEQARQDLGDQAAASGLGPKGLGGQQVAQATQQQNTAEARQAQSFQRAKEQQNLFKNRTFEDLLRSDELAKTSATEGKKQAKFDIDSYLKNLNLETEQGTRSIETSRLSAQLGAESDARAKLVQNFIQSIKNPAQRQAAYSAYGGLL